MLLLLLMVILKDKILYDKKKRNKIRHNYFSIWRPTPKYIKYAPIRSKINPAPTITILNVGIFNVFEIKIPYIKNTKAQNPNIKNFHLTISKLIPQVTSLLQSKGMRTKIRFSCWTLIPMRLD